jgi:hypothetical protein
MGVVAAIMIAPVVTMNLHFECSAIKGFRINKQPEARTELERSARKYHWQLLAKTCQ